MFWCGGSLILCYGSIILCYGDITHRYIGVIHGYAGYTTWLHTHNTQHNAGQFIFLSTGDAVFGRQKRGCQGAQRCTISSLPQPSTFNEDDNVIISSLQHHHHFIITASASFHHNNIIITTSLSMR